MQLVGRVFAHLASSSVEQGSHVRTEEIEG